MSQKDTIDEVDSFIRASEDVMMYPFGQGAGNHSVDEETVRDTRFMSRNPSDRDDSQPQIELDLAFSKRFSMVFENLDESRRRHEPGNSVRRAV